MKKLIRRQMSDSFSTAVFIVLSGGFQDAYTYCCRGRVFANAQTGNIVLLSTALFQKEWQTAFKYMIPVLSFLIGTAAAELIHIKLKHYEKIHWRQIILLCEITMLFLVGFLPNNMEHLANALVSFVCAMQVQTFHKVRGHAYASTMCIGNMRSGMEALCVFFRSHNKSALKKAFVYFSVIAVFGVGAGLGSVITVRLCYKAVWICCAMLFISFCMMFVREKNKVNRCD
ncbi:MAG: YoaK family protein [Acutalibacteraceae bacterium]